VLYLVTTDSWTFSVTVTVAAYAAQTYTNSATNNNAQLASQALLAYLNAPARPWSGVVTWTLSSARSSTAGARFTYACGNIFTLTGGAATCLGLAAGAYAGAATSTADAAGSWWPKVRPAVSSYARDLDAGDASGTGATRPGSPGASLYKPSVEVIGNGTDAARLAVVLKTAASPRVVTVYQARNDMWLSLSLGEIQRSRQGVDYRFSLTCVGA
jgi:hypothetical protein